MSKRSRLFVSTQVKDWGQSPLSRVPITTFLPEQLGAELWLDASDTNTITAAGGSVSQWNNKGSLGNFTQASGAVQPTTGATTLNGKNVIDFAADYLTAANTNEWKFLHDGTDYIFAAVWKAGTSSDPNTIYSVMSNKELTTVKIGVSVWYDDRASASRNNRLTHSVFRGVDGSIVVNNASSDGYFAANTFSVTSILSDPNNGTAANRSAMHLNGGSAVANNTGTQTPSTSNPTHALQIGADGNNGNALTGSVAEIVIVSGANATESNRAALRDYLNGKWGVY